MFPWVLGLKKRYANYSRLQPKNHHFPNFRRNVVFSQLFHLFQRVDDLSLRKGRKQRKVEQQWAGRGWNVRPQKLEKIGLYHLHSNGRNRELVLLDKSRGHPDDNVKKLLGFCWGKKMTSSWSSWRKRDSSSLETLGPWIGGFFHFFWWSQCFVLGRWKVQFGKWENLLNEECLIL